MTLDSLWCSLWPQEGMVSKVYNSRLLGVSCQLLGKSTLDVMVSLGGFIVIGIYVKVV